MSTFGKITSHFSIDVFTLDNIYIFNLKFLIKHRSVDCFRLGWPMRADSDFFCKTVDQLRSEKNGVSMELEFLL